MDSQIAYTASELDDLPADEVRAIAELNDVDYTTKRNTIPEIVSLGDEVLRPEWEAETAPEPQQEPALSLEPEPEPEATPEPTQEAPPAPPISQRRINLLHSLGQPLCRSCGQTRSTDRNGDSICPNNTPDRCQFQ